MTKSIPAGLPLLLLLICTPFNSCVKNCTEPAPNAAPRFHMHFTDTSVAVKSLLLLALQANDANNDRVTFRGLDIPAGSTLDSVTGLFTWRPDTAMSGKTATTKFEASDGTLGDSMVLRIAVKAVLLSKKRYTVPTDFPTIQMAINSANHGDTILVLPGTYKENISFKGKALVIAGRYLTSKDDADIAKTIIRRQADTSRSSLVDMSRCPDSLAPLVLLGFTLRSGFSKFGGGISVSSCSPLIAHCTVDSNFADGST